MTDDLEQRVNEVLEDYPSCGCNIGLRMARLLQQQQAEINRLKSGHLRPMSEAPRDQTQILGLIRDYSKIFPDFWVQATRSILDEDKWFTEHGYIDGNLISGWLPLSDLPTEIEVTA